MPLASLLPVADFADLLPVSEISFDPRPNVESHLTGGGVQISAERAPMLWRGNLALDKMTRDVAVPIENRMLHLARPGMQFMIYDTRRPAPLADPDGAFLGTATPVIASLPSSRELTLSGLPPRYVLSEGDYLAFDYGGRRALHRIVDASVVASTGGVTPAFEVIPPIRPGAAVSAVVTLIKASCKAVMVPKDMDFGRARATITEGARFAFVQDLRA